MNDLTMAAIVVVGIPAVLIGYIVGIEYVLRLFAARRRDRIRPWFWILPAALFLFVFLVYPAIGTVIDSFKDRFSAEFVGLKNYEYIVSSPDILNVLKNNALWLVLFTALTVGFGLVIAVLVDRVKYESTAKSIIFIPLAISFVAAGVIWTTMFAYRPPGAPQVGPLNAVAVALGLSLIHI